MVDMPQAMVQQAQPQQDPSQSGGINLKAYAPVLATIYAEAANKDATFKANVGSSILNRAESGKSEFGADTGNITDVLQHGYYSYSKQSPKYKEAINQSFPDKPSENSYKEVVRVFAGLMNEDIPRSQAQFFFNNDEIKKQSKLIKSLEPVSTNGGFTFYKYKDSSSPKVRK